MKKFLAICLLLISLPILANSSMNQAFEEGKTTQATGSLPNLDDIGFNKIPDLSGFTNLSDQDLTTKSSNELNNTELGKMLIESDISKTDAIAEYQINSKNAVFKDSLAIEADPLKAISGDNYTVTEVISKVKVAKTCLDGVQFDVDIVRQLVLQTDLFKSWSPWKTTSYNEYWAKIDSKFVLQGQLIKNILQQDLQQFPNEDYLMTLEFMGVNLEKHTGPMRIYEKIPGSYMEAPTACRYKHCDRIEQLKITAEYWQIINKASESLLTNHQCYVQQRSCLESGNKLFHGQYQLYRPCWKEQINYHCQSEPINGCKYLTDQNCYLDNSICSKKTGNICLQWQRNYSCFSEKKELRSSPSKTELFCLSGDCHTPIIEGNDDFHNVGYLAMLNEMRKDMKTGPISIFKGSVETCDKCLVKFVDCCSSMKGWGKDIGLASCSAGEKALALKKEKGLCYVVGTYCYRKDPVFKHCLKKKTSYCCFESKLARTFQQQGKVQLGIGFGSAENPNCRGFTVEELQKVDFSQFNLEELFADLIASGKSKVNKKIPMPIENQIPIKQNDRHGNEY